MVGSLNSKSCHFGLSAQPLKWFISADFYLQQIHKHNAPVQLWMICLIISADFYSQQIHKHNAPVQQALHRWTCRCRKVCRINGHGFAALANCELNKPKNSPPLTPSFPQPRPTPPQCTHSKRYAYNTIQFNSILYFNSHRAIQFYIVYQIIYVICCLTIK